jgi:long-subunit fatty acid transport protein
MHRLAPRCHLVSVKGDDFDFGLGLTDPCGARAEVAAQKVVDLLNP